jgi:hypothetical protein
MSFLTLLLAPLAAILIYAVFVFGFVGLAALLLWVLNHDIFL